jgi:tRNA A-37 threonylcarbamoyl transferase component Bud32
MGRTRRGKNHLRKTRKGGKVLAQGHFAAILDPPIACRDGRDMSKYVTRISKRNLKEDVVSRNHPRLIRKLKEIDPNQKYFFYPEHCEPGILSEENKLDGVTYKSKKNSEIVLKGSDVWNPDLRKTRSWTAFLKLKSKGKKLPMPEKSKEQIDHLYKAIKVMHENGIVHGDLHGKNVIMADDGLPRIIDFGNAVVDAPESLIEEENLSIEDSWPSLDANWRRSR